MSIRNVHFIVGDAQFCTYYIKILNFTWSDVTTETSQKGRKKKRRKKQNNWFCLTFSWRDLQGRCPPTGRAAGRRRPRWSGRVRSGSGSAGPGWWVPGRTRKGQSWRRQPSRWGWAASYASAATRCARPAASCRHATCYTHAHMQTHTRTLRLKCWQWIKWNT